MSKDLISAARAQLFSRVDIASLVLFRIAFGAIMLWEVCRYFSKGWIAKYWIDPAFNFTYPGFHWVQPWPGFGMYLHMGALGVLAMLIAVGAFYRVATVLFLAGFVYMFLLEHALYLNHLYFVCLVSFLMVFVPANRAFSVDARRHPEKATDFVPAWSLWVLRAQLAVVYFYAGIAKLNEDWFRGEPLRSWLAEKSTTPGIGWLFERQDTFYLLSWGGLAFDLLIVPLLLWKRTRVPAFLAAVCFHLLNAWFFYIGIFPWFSIVMTTLFFEPDWPRRLLRKIGVARPKDFPRLGADLQAGELQRAPVGRQRRTMVLLGGYLTLQLLLPFRHWLYPGDVAWTEEGHGFSWRMKLRSKEGDAQFLVTDRRAQKTWQEDPQDYLEPWQLRQMVKRPELIRQFARYLGALKEKELGVPVEVRADTKVQLNDRPAAAMVDPNVDLSKEPYRIGPARWITAKPSFSP